MKHYVYLAGPISGLSLDDCQDWRSQVAQQLDSDNVACLTPLRGKQYLRETGVIHSGAYPNAISSTKGITRRDMFDTHRATVIFANLLGAKRVSIGTAMEIAWAYRAHIPVIVIMEQDNVHHHAMLVEASTYVFETVEEGLQAAKYLLNEELGL